MILAHGCAKGGGHEMRDVEIRAAGELAGGVLGGAGTLIKDIHAATADRVFRMLGPLGVPTRFVHDRVSSAAYGAVSTAMSATPKGAARLVARSASDTATSLANSVPGSVALGALNGAFGDALFQQGNELAMSMAFRRRGEDVTLDPQGVAAAYPDATPRIAVFVHGLCGTDEGWWLLPMSRSRAGRKSYGSRLRDDLGYTPVYLRYNTGLHISENGRELARQLEQLIASWPTRVDEIALVGHSMGGLVARSACHYGADGDARWTRSVRHVFCLGTPHLGAPLERGANVAGWALGKLPETRPFAKLVNGRSVGIKDLRFGNVVETDWCDCDPDEFLNDRCCEVPFLECATYYFVGATITKSELSPLGRAIGDLLVQLPSASGNGKRRRIPFEVDNGRHIGGLTHFDLLNNPAVYDLIRDWIDRPGAAELPPPQKLLPAATSS
jgi:pimeloyl-ACP methyl ester carboxylesterase